MKINKLLIIGLITAPFLTGCFHQAEKTSESQYPSAPSQALELAQISPETEKDVELALKAGQEENRITVQVTLQNPSQKPIASAQAWLSYNPQVLRGISAQIDSSVLDIPAPYVTGFDPVLGVIKLGAATSAPVTDTVIPVATLVFEKTGEGVTTLDAYDYRDSLSGHTSANVLIENKPYNVLKKPVTPLLIIQN